MQHLFRLKVLVIILSALIFNMNITAETKPRILLLPMEINANSPQYNTVSSTLYETILLSLRLLGEHEIILLDNSGIDEETLTAFMSEQFIDNAVTGMMTVTDTGEILFDLDLYNRDVEIADQFQAEASGILDVFDASDELLGQLLGAFHGGHIGFGSLKFINNGFPGNYELFLGDIPLGNNLEKTDQLLIGDYELIIQQERFGRNKIVGRHFLSIAEQEELTVDINLPSLLPEERIELDSRHEQLVNLLAQKGGNNPSDVLLAETFSYLNQINTSTEVGEQIQRFQLHEARWQLRREWWEMEEAALYFPDEDLKTAIDIFDSNESWVQEELKDQASLNARLYCHILSMKAAQAFEEKDTDSGMAYYNRILETGRAFGSTTAFGFLGEYEQLAAILDDEQKSDRRKEKEINDLVS